jgi:hypothetical protein
LNKKSANDIICGANETFGFTILRRGVGTREAESNPIVSEESAKGVGEKLATIITLHALNGYMKLSTHELTKFLNYRTSIRFISQRKGP